MYDEKRLKAKIVREVIEKNAIYLITDFINSPAHNRSVAVIMLSS